MHIVSIWPIFEYTHLTTPSLFECLQPPKPQFVQAVRYLYYQLLDKLLDKHRSALKSLGNDFITGYIHTIQGEKDPRNLMLVFGMNRVILIEFQTESHTDVRLVFLITIATDNI